MWTDKDIERTSFIDDELYKVLNDVLLWLAEGNTIKIGKTKMHRNNSFYVTQLVQSYDSETGYCIDVYHGKIPT